MFISPMKNLAVNAAGHLTIGGVDCVDIAKEYGTPAYVLDEAAVRESMRMYRDTMEEAFGKGSMPYFASKALSCKYVYRLAAEEGIGIDVVSPGEIATAHAAGFPLERAIFHGNNKTDADIRYALTLGVGRFAVDNMTELDILDVIAGEMGKKVKIQLRITPGIDPHTHKAVVTGNIASKFGSAIATGQAMEIVRAAAEKANLELVGLHCHIGSQIFDADPFIDAARIMIAFIADIKREVGVDIAELNLGGGYGVRYTNDDPEIDREALLRRVADEVKKLCAANNVAPPHIFMEPGRSIVAGAGITLYTVGSVKEITGFLNYVSIDGGMPDNPRYALYGSLYESYIANRAAEVRDYICTIAGRCCESGDLIAEDTKLQKPHRGEILAVAVTGAYNYAMASNYNRIPRPPILVVKNGKVEVAVKRETYEDLYRLDV
ncbi:MAG: diaminopimelate decarboxylase [Clostridia bacterium]|nr:diaminopimelate decarboxylase [Clostridia bacterium]